MSSNITYINTIPSNKHCSKCNSLLFIRNYKELPIRLSRRKYYFSEWDYCNKCFGAFFEEKNKIILTDEDRERILNGFKKQEETKSLF